MRERFENEWFPVANSMGVSWQEFWHMNPHIINLLMKGHRERLKEMDYMNWLSNQYTLSAVLVAIDRGFSEKPKLEYVSQPFLLEALENEGMTEEEIMEKEIEKAILAERKYAALAKARGLPEIKLK